MTDSNYTPPRIKTCNKCLHCGKKGSYITCDHPDVKGYEEAVVISEDFAEECGDYQEVSGIQEVAR